MVQRTYAQGRTRSLAAEQVGKLLADVGEACRGIPPLRQGSTLRALRGLDALGLRRVFHGRLVQGSGRSNESVVRSIGHLA